MVFWLHFWVTQAEPPRLVASVDQLAHVRQGLFGRAQVSFYEELIAELNEKLPVAFTLADMEEEWGWKKHYCTADFPFPAGKVNRWMNELWKSRIDIEYKK